MRTQTGLRGSCRHAPAQVIIEALEGRRLLSGTMMSGALPLVDASAAVTRRPHLPVTIVNLLGQFSGQLVINGGSTDTITLNITAQHGRNVRGTFTQGSGGAGAFTGSISRTNVLHLSFHGTNNHSHGTVTAAVSSNGNSFSGTFVSIGRHRHSTGTISATRV
jgi:hypothetical protein